MTPTPCRKTFKKLARRGELQVCYEAGPCGYEFRRLLQKVGVSCEVIAPSLIPRRPGDKVKTDRRDACKLARYYRAGELTVIRVPSDDEEAARDLVRCREDVGEDLNRQRHRLLKFLLRHGRVFGWESPRLATNTSVASSWRPPGTTRASRSCPA